VPSVFANETNQFFSGPMVNQGNHVTLSDREGNRPSYVGKTGMSRLEISISIRQSSANKKLGEGLNILL
jgi:hypothetical protein